MLLILDEKRLKKFGSNIFEREENFYYAKLLWRQFKSPLVFVLLIAGLVAFFLGEITNALVIFIAVFINTGVGIFQEGKASRALDKIKHSQKRHAIVLREGGQRMIESSNLFNFSGMV